MDRTMLCILLFAALCGLLTVSTDDVRARMRLAREGGFMVVNMQPERDACATVPPAERF